MRRIVIHWTFIQDDDGSQFAAESAKRRSNELSILPSQFSPNADERSMDAVNAYLKWKKEEKRLLRELNAATNKASSFLLQKATLNDDTFDKALGIGGEVWFAIPLEGADALAEVFKRRFVDGNKAFNNVALSVDLRLCRAWLVMSLSGISKEGLINPLPRRSA